MIPLHAMTLRAALLTSSALIAACAAPAAHWEKPGATQTMVDEAVQECRVQARLSPEQRVGTQLSRPGTAGAMDRIEEREGREAERFQRCMLGKGYSAKR